MRGGWRCRSNVANPGWVGSRIGPRCTRSCPGLQTPPPSERPSRWRCLPRPRRADIGGDEVNALPRATALDAVSQLWRCRPSTRRRSFQHRPAHPQRANTAAVAAPVRLALPSAATDPIASPDTEPAETVNRRRARTDFLPGDHTAMPACRDHAVAGSRSRSAWCQRKPRRKPP